MTRRMLVDAAHSEEVRVVVVNDEKIEDFEVETAGKEQIKGNIYVAEVSRVEPSLQAAFIEYGGNRNGFLAFNEIHPQWFDLPEEEKAELMAELDEIASRRRKRTEDQEVADEKYLEEKAAKSEKSDKSEAIASDEAKSDEKTDEAKATEKPKRRRGRPSKKQLEEEKAAAKTETQEKVEENSSDDRTPEEVEEDARALAMATAMAETELDPSEKPKRGGRRPRRATKKPVASDEIPAALTESENDQVHKIEEEIEEESQAERKQPIHRRYHISDVVKEGQKILIQVNKEERGNKGAALSTYISMPGRFVVLMPNTPYAGGISRKITDLKARRELKKAITDLHLPESMGLIVRTAGVGRDSESIQRDVTNLTNHWEKIQKAFKESKRKHELVHEDGSLVIRAARDMMSEDVDEILISGRRAYRNTKDYIKAIMPEMAKTVKEHRAATPIFTHHGVEEELNQLHRMRVELPSGGYLIINPTEALVSVDVNSGRATQEKNIEETALKTNIEAAEEVCRQLRLRDLAGLVVIDFIDMEDRKNERTIEKTMRKSIRKDRARVQLAPISQFGLMEMSRQRLRPSLGESTMIPCSHCNGAGHVPSLASAALMLLRGIEDEISNAKALRAIITTSVDLAVYVLNHKRDLLQDIEARYKFQILIRADEKYIGPDHRLELIRVDANGNEKKQSTEVTMRAPSEDDNNNKNRRRRRGGRGRKKNEHTTQKSASPESENKEISQEESGKEEEKREPRTRRGRRGGRRRDHEKQPQETSSTEENSAEKSTKPEEGNEDKPKRTRSRRPNNRRENRKPTTENQEVNAKPVETEKTESSEKPKRKPSTRTRRPAPAKENKGIVVETVDVSGQKKVEEAKGGSAVGKAFQRWWGKS